LSFAGTTDRIGVRYLPFLGAELASGDPKSVARRVLTNRFDISSAATSATLGLLVAAPARVRDNTRASRASCPK
jgi:hypothetical protein